jgi:hypothetical protein
MRQKSPVRRISGAIGLPEAILGGPDPVDNGRHQQFGHERQAIDQVTAE